MKPKTIILMIVAIACGLGASYGTTRLIADRKKEPEAKTVPVLVAKTNVPKWKRIQKPEEFFEIHQMNEKDAPNSRYGSFDEVKVWRLRKELSKDQHLSPDDILDGNIQPLDLPKGYGAKAIQVTAVATAGYFVHAGDRVDLHWTSRRSGSNVKTDSKSLLENLLVVAVGAQTTKTRTPEEQQVTGSTVTFAVKPNEARLLDVAESTGSTRLYLLNNEDNVPADRDDLEEEELHSLIAELNGIDKNKIPAGGTQVVGKFGKEIPKPEPKEFKPDVEEVRPVHSVRIRSGNSAPVRLYLYEDGHGGRVVDRDPVKHVEKNPQPKAEAKTEEAPKEQPEAKDDAPESEAPQGDRDS